MILTAAAGLTFLSLAWLAAGVPEATVFFWLLAALYLAVWAVRRPRVRRVAVDWRYCLPPMPVDSVPGREGRHRGAATAAS